MTRRDFFASLLPSRWPPASRSDNVASAASPESSHPTVAVIAGRHCLAYQGSFCSTCRERCPVPGAIVIERGLPRVNPDLCNGCRICHELCPAPINAILLVDAALPRTDPPTSEQHSHLAEASAKPPCLRTS